MYCPIHIPAVWTLCRIVYMHSPRDSTAIDIVFAQMRTTLLSILLNLSLFGWGSPREKPGTSTFQWSNDLKVGQSLGKALTF